MILPSLAFNNVSAFLNTVKPPFYETYNMVIVNDYVSNDPCFGGYAFYGKTLTLVGMLLPLVAAVFFY